jgi:hypothetical protein
MLLPGYRTWMDTSRPATILSYLTLLISRLVSNACLQHKATATMLNLYTSSVWDSHGNALMLRLWLCLGAREMKHPGRSSQYTQREELCQCYHRRLPRTCNASCVSCISRYGDEVVSVILFGSWAKGEARAESDRVKHDRKTLPHGH